MKLTLGYSPCPNDTFIFDAMVHGKIDTEGLEFEVVLADVEELNSKAFNTELDITKLSYHTYGYLTKDYLLLDSGSALGKGCGPILIQNKNGKWNSENLSQARIAIPGKFTTANFLMSIAHPKATNKEEVLFSDIEEKVKSGEVDAGLIIHENRFTYEDRGFEKIIDLGEYWEQQTGTLIPLGGIVIKRDLPDDVIQKVNRILRKSVEHAFRNPKSALPYIKEHAQEMEEEVMYQHIDLYVNQYSIDLGLEGKHAIEQMFKLAQEKKIIPGITKDIFINKKR